LHTTQRLPANDVVIAKSHDRASRRIAQLLLDPSNDVLSCLAIVTARVVDLVEVEPRAQSRRLPQLGNDVGWQLLFLDELVEAFVCGARGFETGMPLLTFDTVVVRQRERLDERPNVVLALSVTRTTRGSGAPDLPGNGVPAAVVTGTARTITSESPPRNPAHETTASVRHEGYGSRSRRLRLSRRGTYAAMKTQTARTTTMVPLTRAVTRSSD
jgi:hypothetical protein